MADYNSRINEIDSELMRSYTMDNGEPQTRAEGLHIKDLEHERAMLMKQRFRAVHRPGYENLMTLRGQGRKLYGM